MTFTLSPITVKDKDGAAKPMVAFTDGTNNAFANAQLDAAGHRRQPDDRQQHPVHHRQ